MDANWRTSLWQQFGAAIDMLDNAVAACPDELWRVRLWDDAELPESAEFWYIVYHTLFWLDLYLSGAVEGFAPRRRSRSTSWTRPGCCRKDHTPGMSCWPISNTTARSAGRRSRR